MFLGLILTCGLVCADDLPAVAAPAADATREIYRRAAAQTGKNADAQVKLALWCESHGLSGERMKHLALAVLYDPPMRWHAGSWAWSATRASGRRPDR